MRISVAADWWDHAALVPKVHANERVPYFRKLRRIGRSDATALLPKLERGPWSTAEGAFRLEPRYIELPVGGRWAWVTEWLVDTTAGGLIVAAHGQDDVATTDDARMTAAVPRDGWAYAPRWDAERWRTVCAVGCHVRRRRWVRVREALCVDRQSP
jgi:hypothetical protein